VGLGARPGPRSSLEEALRDRGWATNTFNTYLSRLTEKGFVSCEKRGKTNYYTPQVRQADYLAFESGAVLNKVFGSSLKSFVASLARGGALRDGELDELQQYLEELRRGDRP
jgi:predicted transcriptional regulator